MRKGRDFGVIIHKFLRCGHHIAAGVKNANKVLRMIKNHSDIILRV